MFKSDFLQIMFERGFIHQISDEKALDDLFANEKVTAYIGFDPTAESLHVGSLVQIMALYWLQQTGHKPIVLMGGGTGLIGDPSFKDEARQMLSTETINGNVASLKQVFANYLSFEEDKALMLNNIEWLKNINYLEFLRDVGKYFSINKMLSFESVKMRLEREQSLSFLEFNYMILQAYDFVELNKKYGARVQLGGSDQWGNIINGLDLAHKMQLPQLYAITTPLLTTASGAKMGKTANGAIWLNSNMLDAYSFWQYWRNCDDADVIRFLKLYTTLSLEEINSYNNLKGSELNEVKKILATEVTSMLHGKTAAKQAEDAANKLFENNILSDDLPRIIISEDNIGLLSLIVKAGFAKSNSEARRSIKAGAIKINDKAITDETMIVSSTTGIKLSFGKKKHILITLRS